MQARRPLKQYDVYSHGTKLGGVSAYDLDDALTVAKGMFADPVTMVAEWHLPLLNKPEPLRFRITRTIGSRIGGVERNAVEVR